MVLVVTLDPRTWGQEVEGHGDEIGVVLGAQWAASFLLAMLVLAAVVVAVETVVRARARTREDSSGTSSSRMEDPAPTRSWYE